MGQVLLWSCELPALTRKRASCSSDLQKTISRSHHFLFQATADEALLEAAQKPQVLGSGPSVSCWGARWAELRVERPGGWGDGRGCAATCCREGAGDTGKPGFLPCAPRQVTPHPNVGFVSPLWEEGLAPAPRGLTCVCAHIHAALAMLYGYRCELALSVRGVSAMCYGGPRNLPLPLRPDIGPQEIGAEKPSYYYGETAQTGRGLVQGSGDLATAAPEVKSGSDFKG